MIEGALDPRPSLPLEFARVLTGSAGLLPRGGASDVIFLRCINDLGCSVPDLQVHSAPVKV